MEIRGRKTEVGNQRIEDRGWKIENNEQRTTKKFSKKSQLNKICITFAQLVKLSG